MSDFDFDEIDKAVNSALNSQATPPPSATDDDSATRDEAATVAASRDGRQANITVPSRSSTASLAVHDRTMNSRRVPRFDEATETATTPPVTEDPTAASQLLHEEAAEQAESATTGDKNDESVTDFSDMNAAVNSIVEAGETSETEEVAPAASHKPGLPSRRSGRFMDVVHPSSDMKTATMSGAPSRKAATIEPLNSDEKDALLATDDQVEVASPQVEPDEKADVPPPIDLDKPLNTELTSQIDSLLAGEESVATTPTHDDNQSVADTATTKADTAPTDEQDHLEFEETPDKQTTAPEPQNSPFLEGVTVEKRPLGEANAGSQPLPEKAADDGKKAGYSEELKHPDDVTAAEVLPDELDTKLVSIEAADMTETAAPTAKAAPAAQTTADKVKKKSPAEPTSIAKQYKQKDRPQAEAANDIFDTKNYHTPIKDNNQPQRISPLVLTGIILAVVVIVAAGIFAAWWGGLFTLPF